MATAMSSTFTGTGGASGHRVTRDVGLPLGSPEHEGGALRVGRLRGGRLRLGARVQGRAASEAGVLADDAQACAAAGSSPDVATRRCGRRRVSCGRTRACICLAAATALCRRRRAGSARACVCSRTAAVHLLRCICRRATHFAGARAQLSKEYQATASCVGIVRRAECVSCHVIHRPHSAYSVTHVYNPG